MDKNNDNLKITWEWFEFHADQRLRAFYYFLIITGALAFGYIQCIGGCEQLKMVSPFISGLGILVSIAFFCLEIRNVELVNIGRIALRRYKFEPVFIDYSHREEDERIKELYDKQEIEELKRYKETALKDAIGKWQGLYWIERYLKHEYWLRLIYLSTLSISFVSLIYALYILFEEIMLFWVTIGVLLFFAILLVLYMRSSPWMREQILKK
ncbi:MAG: hypothetical protein WC618_05460 [Patescibacteria group bacterium]